MNSVIERECSKRVPGRCFSRKSLYSSESESYGSAFFEFQTPFEDRHPRFRVSKPMIAALTKQTAEINSLLDSGRVVVGLREPN